MTTLKERLEEIRGKAESVYDAWSMHRTLSKTALTSIIDSLDGEIKTLRDEEEKPPIKFLFEINEINSSKALDDLKGEA